MQRLLQFTLDLFEPEPAAPAVHPSKPPVSVPNRPPAQVERALPAIETIAKQDLANAAPARPQTLRQALAPATYRHPRATREALLDDVLVAYEFKRGKRRTIGFSVGAEGLAVRAPKWVPLHEIDKSVLEKSGWILKKLQETRARHARLESARIDWKDGASLLFLGEAVTVRLDPRHGFGGVGAELLQRCLHVGLPHSATPGQIGDMAQAWLMRQAKQLFIERLNHFAPQLGVQWNKLSLSSAGTRWGSASSNGSIRLNWRLIHFRPAVIDYVVVHELSHLRVMDHSPRFWDTVRAVVPDYAQLRGQLKDETIPRW
ncbi:SprT family zinc-dependent metalloprotease [Polaromonas sp.]|uniref:M48 family metallopeptidase n=1 Tax=Polaromonas sp. TaxID=1869339 RepID=UPI00286C1963|nr:SprT family zinc-dependent metalloprotease [Polaromonas sp.]